jgi:hypothetical protein
VNDLNDTTQSYNASLQIVYDIDYVASFLRWRCDSGKASKYPFFFHFSPHGKAERLLGHVCIYYHNFSVKTRKVKVVTIMKTVKLGSLPVILAIFALAMTASAIGFLLLLKTML